MLSNDPKAGTFETALTEDGEEELKEEGKQAEGTFSSATSTLSTSLPKASSTMKEVKETGNQKDVIHALDKLHLRLWQPGNVTIELKPSGVDTGGIW